MRFVLTLAMVVFVVLYSYGAVENYRYQYPVWKQRRAFKKEIREYERLMND